MTPVGVYGVYYDVYYLAESLADAATTLFRLADSSLMARNPLF